MCIGSSALLVEVWEDGGASVGRLGDGHVVSLAFLPEAEPGDVVLLHLGIPVEVLASESTKSESTQPEGAPT
jgi:hydrogenase maturation factor